MKIAICDDDKIFLEEISSAVKDVFSDTKTEAEFDLYNDSRELFASEKSYDMAFVDIEMPHHSGIETAQKLKEINPHIIIFIVTSYDQYLDEAMDLNVFRYIKKPLDTVRLKNGIERAFKVIDTNQITFFLKCEQPCQTRVSKSIKSNDIIYVEIVGRGTHIVTEKGEFVSSQKINYFKEKLVASFFYQTHKSYLINMNYITDYHHDNVLLCDKYKIPIAHLKKSDFKSAFAKFFGGR